MILSYNDIKDRVEKYKNYGDVYENNNPKVLIEKFNKKNLQSASYDISIGSEFMVQNKTIATIDLSSKAEIEKVFVKKSIHDDYIIEPNEFILVMIDEKINMPDDLSASVRPRTSFNKLGLVLTNQHINPSYSGNLYVGLKNVSNNAYIIKPGLKIGQIIFETLSSEIPEEFLYRNKKDSKYQNEGREYIHSKVYNEFKKENLEEALKIIKEEMASE